MSTKSTIFLTHDNEHCYNDSVEETKDNKGNWASPITMEFDKKNIKVICDDEDDLTIEITNVNSELFEIFNNLRRLNYNWLKERDLI